MISPMMHPLEDPDLHGPHGPVNGFAKFAAAVGIACLGSPRARPVAIFVLVLLAAAAFWVWS